MKILRVFDGEPVEFELTWYEIRQAYQEFDDKRIKDDILYALESEETDESEKMIRILKFNPILFDRVAMQYREFISDAIGGDEELDCAKAAWKYVVESLEVLA